MAASAHMLRGLQLQFDVGVVMLSILPKIVITPLSTLLSMTAMNSYKS